MAEHIAQKGRPQLKKAGERLGAAVLACRNPFHLSCPPTPSMLSTPCFFCQSGYSAVHLTSCAMSYASVIWCPDVHTVVV